MSNWQLFFKNKETHPANFHVKKELVEKFVEEAILILYPGMLLHEFKTQIDIEKKIESHLKNLQIILEQTKQGERFLECKACYEESLLNLQELIDLDAKAILAGDPAATCLDEVILCYPGLFAVAIHRLAHLFHQKNIRLIPRLMTEYAHQKTGIDIHPGASIGHSFFIDHGTGVVIGETTIIGNHVKIYQGVTLGALSVEKEMAKTKRHPTIEDNCVIYAHATILGGDTVVKNGSIIGGNVWLTKSIGPDAIVYHQSTIKYDQKNKHETKGEME